MEKMNPKSFYLTQTSIINCNGTCKKKTLRNQEKQTWELMCTVEKNKKRNQEKQTWEINVHCWYNCNGTYWQKQKTKEYARETLA